MVSTASTQLFQADIPHDLAPYATNWRESQGRFFDEPGAGDRTPYQRDRDRIIYADSFRRLQYKTQVFTNSEEGDFRTRLTHSLEVAQLTRTICRALKLDEDLGETIALVHDLGHPPFGHSGEGALQKMMKNYGGFNHNHQTIRIVRELETRYASFDGLNLTYESLEGIAKHNGPLSKAEQKLTFFADLSPSSQPGLEAQVAALCDQLAYNHHDLEDGLATGKLHLEQVLALPSFAREWELVTASYPRLDQARQVTEAIRRMVHRQVKDLLNQSHANLHENQPKNVAEVRQHKEFFIGFSPVIVKESHFLCEFLFENMYRHVQVNRRNFQGFRIIEALFDAFMNHKRMLPENYQQRLSADSDDAQKAKVVCDYIASLTDRSAALEYHRMFGPIEWK